MDLGPWSPAHTILALFIVAGFIGQVAVYFHRTAQNGKRIERLEERMDKRFADLINTMNQGFSDIRSEMNQDSSDIRSEMNQDFSDIRSEMNQGFSDIRSEMNQRLSDMQVEIRDVRLELGKLNQNHIDHLNQHHSG